MAIDRRVLVTGILALVPAQALAQANSEDDVRAVVAEMLAEADQRSSLLAGGNGGHEGTFFLASDDGAFRLNITGFLQTRYYADFRDEDNTVGSEPGDDFEPGFQMRNMKLGFDGQIYKDWSYNVLMNFSKSTGTAGLQDAYVDYAINSNWKVRFGQAKVPLLHEELVADQRQLVLERSLVNTAFTQGRSQLVMLNYRTDAINFAAAFSDGINSDNTDFTAPESTTFIVSGEADWAATARFEYALAGPFKQFDDMTAEVDGPFAALLGAAIHYQQSPNTAAVTDIDRDTLEYTFDVSVEGGGWNLYGAFIGRNDNFRGSGGESEFDDFAVVAQGGFRLGAKWEPYVRYEGFFLDSDRGFDDDTNNILTVGVNHYIAGNAIKISGDVVIPFENTADLVSSGILPNTGVGLLGDSEEGEVVLRLQFQLLF